MKFSATLDIKCSETFLWQLSSMINTGHGLQRKSETEHELDKQLQQSCVECKHCNEFLALQICCETMGTWLLVLLTYKQWSHCVFALSYKAVYGVHIQHFNKNASLTFFTVFLEFEEVLTFI